jgi:pyridoxal phosphate enzyme (YggS family)
MAAAKVAAMSLEEITARLDAAVERAGRPAGSVTLVAVSKVQPAERVAAVIDAGQRVFGENRVQEAEERWPPFQARHPDLSLHLVGPLQTNKLVRALDLFDAIHSLDRDRLARKLADAVQERGGCPDLFVQVNTGREPQKAGIAPEALDGFVAACRGTYGLPLLGLMAIPPVDAPAGPHFTALREMAARNGLSGLSMGMSDDFEEAVACGATHVRIGSALFGQRSAPA